MSLIAVDIGNSRIKLGHFAVPGGEVGLPTPTKILSVSAVDLPTEQLEDWLRDISDSTVWWIASVNRPATVRLTQWIERQFKGTPKAARPAKVRLLSHFDLPIKAAVEYPNRVGIDRLAGAVAANRLRNSARPAIIVDVGSAITVDLVNSQGIFCGGAILPGIGMSARALHEFTDLLPHSPLEELTGPPPALGTATLPAIHSGLYWGAVGAMRELVLRLSQTLPSGSAQPELFLTGGAAPSVAATLDPAARYVEHLVLAGIALATPGPEAAKT